MTDGTHECGRKSLSHFKDDSVSAKCEAEAGSGKLTVRVDTNLKGHKNEESFAIDNVVISQISAGK